MIKPSQLRKLISDTLMILLPEMHSPEAVELLMMTAAQESHSGTYLQQVGCGVALGIFQVEPATYRDLHDNYLRYHRDLGDRMFSAFQIGRKSFSIHMRGNLPYQICISRLQYRRFPERIPEQASYIDITEWEHALACYYKKYWNTELGKATIPEVIRNYAKYAK